LILKKCFFRTSKANTRLVDILLKKTESFNFYMKKIFIFNNTLFRSSRALFLNDCLSLSIFNIELFSETNKSKKRKVKFGRRFFKKYSSNLNRIRNKIIL